MKKHVLLIGIVASFHTSIAQTITFLGSTHRVTTPSGNIDIGAQNGNWAHIYSDRPNIIFNKTIYSHNGQFSAYSTSDLQLQTNGTTRMQVSQATGNVGIGTNSPYSRLEISPTSASWGEGIIVNPAPNNYGAIFFRETQGLLNGTWFVGKQSSDNFAIMRHSLSGMSGTSRSDAAFEINYTNGNSTFGGNVGIGTSLPISKLDIVGGNGGWTNPTLNLKSSSTNAWSLISLVGGDFDSTGDYMIGRGNSSYSNGRALTLHIPSRSSFYSGSGSLPEISFVSSGSVKLGSIQSETGNWYMKGDVGIGTTTPDEKLTVKGKIHTEEVKVDLSVPAPDYVFANDYNLPTLEEIEKFIKSEKHLPEIPSAKEMEANGVELGAMNMLLLKKIEELTLYTLEQEKEIDNLSKQPQATSDKLSALEIENEELKKELNATNLKLAAYDLQLEALINRIEKLENNTK